MRSGGRETARTSLSCNLRGTSKVDEIFWKGNKEKMIVCRAVVDAMWIC